MNKLYNRIRDYLDSEYTKKIQKTRDTKKKIELMGKRELLQNDEELLKEMKDRRAIYDLGIKDLEREMGLKKEPKEDKAIRDIKAHKEATERMIEEIIKKRGYER